MSVLFSAHAKLARVLPERMDSPLTAPCIAYSVTSKRKSVRCAGMGTMPQGFAICFYHTVYPIFYVTTPMRKDSYPFGT